MTTISGLIVVMGVAGCGKSSVGQSLAAQINAAFIEADELHPPANIEKMSQGHALDDNDRQPWLEAIVEYALQQFQNHRTCVLSCSALKLAYRETLRRAHSQTRFVFLDGSRELILKRMNDREGHFMPTSLLDSQFATLENPQAEADVIAVSIDNNLSAIVQEAMSRLS